MTFGLDWIGLDWIGLDWIKVNYYFDNDVNKDNLLHF